jgi:ParB-like chromosome segregation protein Spo0J
MLEIVYRKTDDLIPYINNARTHSDAQITQIAASIKEFSFANPVLVDGDNGIIAGHGRVMAAKKLGLDEVPTALILDPLVIIRAVPPETVA